MEIDRLQSSLTLSKKMEIVDHFVRPQPLVGHLYDARQIQFTPLFKDFPFLDIELWILSLIETVRFVCVHPSLTESNRTVMT